MRRQIAAAMCAALLGLVTLSSHAMAQQKTVKACQEEWRANKAANQSNGITLKAYVAQCRGGAAPAQTTAAPPPPAPAGAPTATATGQKTAKECWEEWRANKAANQANGVTEKAYVAQCRGGAAPAQTTAAPPPPPAPAAAPEAAAAGQKTAKECREEWRANKATNQANGVTEKAYVAQCRGGAAPAQTTAAPPPPAAPAPAPTAAPAAPAPAPTATAAPAAAAPAPTAAAPPSRAAPPPPPPTAGTAPSVPENPVATNEFTTETQAKARCPSDTVVWVNLTSKIYHFSGTRSYGNTKHGAYMCEGDTTAAGMRAAKNETHP
jgi:hypothetical protein